MGEQLLIKLWMQFTTVSTNVVNDVSLARQAEVCIDGVRSCRWVVICRDAVPFKCCRRLCVAVSRGSPLSESDSRVAWLAETVVAHFGLVMLPSGATPQRHDLRQCVVTSVSVFTVY